MTDWEDQFTEEKLNTLNDRLDTLESRVNSIGESYVAVDKLREDLEAVWRVIGQLGFVDIEEEEGDDE